MPNPISENSFLLGRLLSTLPSCVKAVLRRELTQDPSLKTQDKTGRAELRSETDKQSDANPQELISMDEALDILDQFIREAMKDPSIPEDHISSILFKG